MIPMSFAFYDTHELCYVVPLEVSETHYGRTPVGV